MAVWCCLIVVFIIINRAQAAASPRHVNYQYHWENIEAQLLYFQRSLLRGRQRSWAWTWTTCRGLAPLHHAAAAAKIASPSQPGVQAPPPRVQYSIWWPLPILILSSWDTLGHSKLHEKKRRWPWWRIWKSQLNNKEVFIAMDYINKCLIILKLTCYSVWGLRPEDSPCTMPSPAPASLNRLPPPTGTTAASRCWSIQSYVCSNCSIVH